MRPWAGTQSYCLLFCFKISLLPTLWATAEVWPTRLPQGKREAPACQEPLRDQCHPQLLPLCGSESAKGDKFIPQELESLQVRACLLQVGMTGSGCDPTWTGAPPSGNPEGPASTRVGAYGEAGQHLILSRENEFLLSLQSGP